MDKTMAKMGNLGYFAIYVGETIEEGFQRKFPWLCV